VKDNTLYTLLYAECKYSKHHCIFALDQTRHQSKTNSISNMFETRWFGVTSVKKTVLQTWHKVTFSDTYNY